MFRSRTIIFSSVLLFKLLFLAVVEAQVPNVRPITQPGMNVEAVRYDSVSKVVLFADHISKTIVRYNPVTLTLQVLQLDERAAFIIPVRDFQYSFLVGLDRNVEVLDWNYESIPSGGTTYTTAFDCLLASVDSYCHANRWNTGTVDGYGNLWAGTLTILDCADCDCPPALYRGLTTQPGVLRPDVAVQSFYSNGIEFSVDYRIMYTIDYTNRQVYSFNFDLIHGVISCPTVVFRYDDFNLTGIPDSITKDTDGNLWIGSFKGGQVIQINPNTNELLQTLDIPASRVTSVAIGGFNLDLLFVGTMISDDPAEQLLEPLAGSLFEVVGLGIKGYPEQEAVVNSLCKPFFY